MNKEPIQSSITDFKGALFDLDGVITNSARLHAKAWKLMFDEFLKTYNAHHNQTIPLLSIKKDYPELIDGKPRFDGVRSFLASRGIDAPEGNPSDAPGQGTINGLCKRKNNIFRSLLEQEPIEVYQKHIDAIRNWRKMGLKTAIISSSKNCATILEQTQLNELFDVRIDGVTAEQQGLKGKPNPDIFLEGARRLNLAPADCMVFEDATAGVKAGKSGKFGLVIGIATHNAKALLESHGADVAVTNFDELKQYIIHPKPSPEKLDNALAEAFYEKWIADYEPALYLDYDGTLTPIVENPEDAVIPESIQKVLAKLATRIPVAIISGRNRHQVKEFVGIENIYYAGSHGFDITGPNNLHMEVEEAQALLPYLDEIEKKLRHQTQAFKGVQVERKKFAIAIHYRNASADLVPELKGMVDQVVNYYNAFKLSGGKKIFEIKPNIDWDKGKAVEWLIKELHLNKPSIMPIYIGDDLTDEDAFRSLISKGVGILVGDHGHPTFARYHLDNIEAVESFLKKIYNQLNTHHE